MVDKELRPGLFNLGPRWVRFDKYEVFEDEKEILYIIPSVNAKIENYRPFEYYPEMLRDFLNMATQIKDEFGLTGLELKQVERQNAKVYLDFISKYGLFGLICKDGEDSLKTPLRMGIELDKTWFPRLKNNFPNPINSNEVHRFWQEYAEPINFMSDMVNLYNMFETWNSFVESGDSPNDFIHPGFNNQRWRDILETNYAYPIGLGLIYDGTWQLSWSFDSLMQAIAIMWLNDITSNQQKVRICQYCGRAFIARSPKARYCPKANGLPSTCGTNARVNRHREKSKPAE